MTGARQAGIANHEYDVTVISLASQQSRSTAPPVTDASQDRATNSLAAINHHLKRIAQEKHQRLPTSASQPFTPLVFTLGGLTEKGTERAINIWKSLLPAGTFRHLLMRLALVLFRARVRNFCL